MGDVPRLGRAEIEHRPGGLPSARAPARPVPCIDPARGLLPVGPSWSGRLFHKGRCLLKSLPVDTLRQLLRLDVETGRLFWLPRGVEWFRDGKQTAAASCASWNGKHAGKPAFCIQSHGYMTGHAMGMRTSAHRIVFALVSCRWPTDEIDHIDGDRSNNIPSNLREANRYENKRNVLGHSDGSSKFCGVSWSAERNKWVAQCMDDAGTQRNLGRFLNEADAARAYDTAAIRWHGEFARINFPQKGVA